jgi:hypothetical protein
MKIILFIISVIVVVQSQKVCNLRIAENKMSAFKGTDIIYDNGKLFEDRYSANALVPYTSDITKDIEYLYAWEIHTKDAHTPIVIYINIGFEYY